MATDLKPPAGVTSGLGPTVGDISPGPTVKYVGLRVAVRVTHAVLAASSVKEPGGLGVSSRLGVQEGEPSEMMTRCVSEQNAALTPEKAPTSALRFAVVHLVAVDCTGVGRKCGLWVWMWG